MPFPYSCDGRIAKDRLSIGLGRCNTLKQARFQDFFLREEREERVIFHKYDYFAYAIFSNNLFKGSASNMYI